MKTLTLIFAFFLAFLAASSPLALFCLVPISIVFLALYASQSEDPEDTLTLLLFCGIIPLVLGLVVWHCIL